LGRRRVACIIEIDHRLASAGKVESVAFGYDSEYYCPLRRSGRRYSQESYLICTSVILSRNQESVKSLRVVVRIRARLTPGALALENVAPAGVGAAALAWGNNAAPARATVCAADRLGRPGQRHEEPLVSWPRGSPWVSCGSLSGSGFDSGDSLG